MTVAEVLAAHASSRIAAAQTEDHAHRLNEEVGGTITEALVEEHASFVVSWGAESTVIGRGDN